MKIRINYDDQIEDVIDKFRKELNRMGIMLIVKESGDGYIEYELERPCTE